MSNTLGGDLTAMEGLGSSFAETGGMLKSNLVKIGEEAETARDTFCKDFGTTCGNMETLHGEMDAEKAALRSLFEGTTWTGENRKFLQAAYDEMEQQMDEAKSTMKGFMSKAEGVVNGPLSNNLNSMNEAVRAGAEAAHKTATSFQDAVKSQVTAFHKVFNEHV